MNKHLTDITILDVPKTENMTTQEYIYERLKKTIMLGLIPPGADLPVRGLVSIFQASATPVREAVRRLSSEKALEVLSNRRIMVPKMTRRRFHELLEVRITLETHAALSAEPYISPVIIDQLEKIDKNIDRVFEMGDAHSALLENYKFHRCIYETNPHQVIMSAIESIWLQLGPFHYKIAETGYKNYKVDRHKYIINALRAHDRKALKESLTLDIRDALEETGHKLLKEDAVD